MSNRSVATVCLLALVLAACPKKDEATADAAAEAAASTTVTPTVTADAATAVTAAPPLGGAKVAPASPKADAGIVDAGSAAIADAGVDTCCCEVTGQPLSQVGQSECTKVKKGQCVKKDRCSAAPPPVVDAGPPAQQCCCDTAGKKALRGQSECTKGGAGKCVKLTDCPK